ncbi:MAG: hypothetical protein DRG82_15580 [Deltaproteobacteria bacterium]|nr:MAG: hypothetical protein DRG82_15580 [Deltaproteobacteria bacterium]
MTRCPEAREAISSPALFSDPERKESAAVPSGSPGEREGISRSPPGEGRDSEIRTQGYPVRGMYGGLGPASGAGHCF